MDRVAACLPARLPACPPTPAGTRGRPPTLSEGHPPTSRKADATRIRLSPPEFGFNFQIPPNSADDLSIFPPKIDLSDFNFQLLPKNLRAYCQLNSGEYNVPMKSRKLTPEEISTASPRPTLTLAETARELGIAPSSVHWRADRWPEFPKPVRLKGLGVRWFKDELDAWRSKARR